MNIKTTIINEFNLPDEAAVKEIFMPGCFGEISPVFTFKVLEETWQISPAGVNVRIITKAKLISVDIKQIS